MTDKQKLQERLSEEIKKIDSPSLNTCNNEFDKLLSNEERNNYMFIIDFNKKEVTVIER